MNESEGEVTLLQDELVDIGLRLNETEAGRTLYSELQSDLAKQRDSLRALERDAQKQGNAELAQALSKQLAQMQETFDKTFVKAGRMKISFRRKIVLFFLLRNRKRNVVS